MSTSAAITLSAIRPGEAMSISEGSVLGCAATSFALAPVLRARFFAALALNRAAKTFKKDEVLFELGDTQRTVFLIRQGVVKTGTITDQGREIIYAIRRDGDVVGELCAIENMRRERAVALERTEAVPVSLDEVLDVLAREQNLLREFIGVLCCDLAEAYDQVNRMAEDSVMHGLIKVLRRLATKLGRAVGGLVEISAYVTQEELAQMVVARRERVSTALNSLRRRGFVQYTARGRLLLDMRALEREES